MPRTRKCTVCGQEFLSANGVEVCSEQCRIERKKEQDKKGNYRRYHGFSKEPFDKICPVCGKRFEGLREKYCSKECSSKAKRKAVKELSDRYYLEHKKDQEKGSQ